VHHVGILYGQFMMHGQRNIKLFSHTVVMYAVSLQRRGIRLLVRCYKL